MIYWINNKNDFVKLNVKTLIIGFFDGIHKGHKKLFDFVDDELTVLTFQFDKYSNFIYDIDKRIKIINKLFKPKNIIILNLNKINMNADEFIQKINKFWCQKKIIVGSDFKFGSDLKNAHYLKNFFNVKLIARNKLNNISTTKIKKFLLNGQIKKANKMLVEPYSYHSIIIKGEQLAGQLGFKTANFVIKNNLLIPKFGVYITRSYFDNYWYQSITFIGKPKTFNSNDIKFETHLINYTKSNDFYDKELTVEFIKRIDNVKKYKNIQKLKDGIKRQINITKKYFK